MVTPEQYLVRLGDIEKERTSYIRLLLLATELFPGGPPALGKTFESLFTESKDSTIVGAAALTLKHWGRLDQTQLDKALFAPVAGGWFYRGSREGDPDYEGDNKDGKKRRLAGFEIARYPVTNGDYSAFIAATHNEPPRHWRDGKIPPGLTHHLVVFVSWHGTITYIDWLNQKNDGHQYWLPTEAQWERAARGRAKINRKDNRRIYPWGDEFDATKCNTAETDLNRTTAVGCFPDGVSPDSVFDLAGNVFEWCSDWYDEDYYAEGKVAENMKKSEIKTLRGGAFYDFRRNARCAFRDNLHPDNRNNNIGFRVASTPSLARVSSPLSASMKVCRTVSTRLPALAFARRRCARPHLCGSSCDAQVRSVLAT